MTNRDIVQEHFYFTLLLDEIITTQVKKNQCIYLCAIGQRWKIEWKLST